MPYLNLSSWQECILPKVCGFPLTYKQVSIVVYFFSDGINIFFIIQAGVLFWYYFLIFNTMIFYLYFMTYTRLSLFTEIFILLWNKCLEELSTGQTVCQHKNPIMSFQFLKWLRALHRRIFCSAATGSVFPCHPSGTGVGRLWVMWGGGPTFTDSPPTLPTNSTTMT